MALYAGFINQSIYPGSIQRPKFHSKEPMKYFCQKIGQH